MLNDEEFGSDSDDDDYVPEGDGQGHDASEEENSGDEEDTVGENSEPKKKRTKKKKEKAKVVVNHRMGLFSEDQDKPDWNKELLEEKKEAEEIKEKAKLDNLWSDFKSDVGTKSKTTKPKSAGGLGSLFSASSPSPTVPKQPDSKPKNLFSSLFDTNNDSKEKSEEKVKEKPKSLLSGLFDAEPTNVQNDNKVKEEEAKSSKIEITKVFDFAGEEVKVTKHVDADSTEAQKYLKKQEESAASKTGIATKRPGGLASVVGQISKKQKMGCLDKSKLDWNSFVREEGINEELKTHNKGKDGFVEKQMFLERADLRQFEVEKSMREKVRRQNQQ